MFNKLVCAIILGLFSSTCFSQEVVSTVSYLEVNSYEDSLILAKNQNKKVLVLFTADYCGWCGKQKEVFLDPSVTSSLANYIVCYVDSTSRKDLVAKYKVRPIPAYFVIDHDENIIKKHVGYKGTNEFIRWIKK